MPLNTAVRWLSSIPIFHISPPCLRRITPTNINPAWERPCIFRPSPLMAPVRSTATALTEISSATGKTSGRRLNFRWTGNGIPSLTRWILTKLPALPLLRILPGLSLNSRRFRKWMRSSLPSWLPSLPLSAAYPPRA